MKKKPLSRNLENPQVPRRTIKRDILTLRSLEMLTLGSLKRKTREPERKIKEIRKGKTSFL